MSLVCANCFRDSPNPDFRHGPGACPVFRALWGPDFDVPGAILSKAPPIKTCSKC